MRIGIDSRPPPRKNFPQLCSAKSKLLQTQTEMEETKAALEVAESISNFGMMAVAAAFFVVLAIVIMVMFVKWFKDIINNIMATNQGMLTRLDDQLKENNDVMKSIAEGLRPETLLRVQTTSEMAFQLAQFRLLEIIDTVRTENHIVNREATEVKIEKLVLNLHEEMNGKFEYYSYRGKKLSSYTNQQWVDWMKAGVINEIYSDQERNEDRTHTNVSAIFKRIALDFNHNLAVL